MDIPHFECGAFSQTLPSLQNNTIYADITQIVSIENITISCSCAAENCMCSETCSKFMCITMQSNEVVRTPVQIHHNVNMRN